MAVMAPREKWTDDRLDDLNRRVDDGFARVEGDIRELRVDVKKQGESLQAEIKSQGQSLRAEMSSGFEKAETNLEKAEKRLEKKIDGVKGDLEKKIDGLGKSVGELRGEINRALVGGVAALVLTQIAGGILFF